MCMHICMYVRARVRLRFKWSKIVALRVWGVGLRVLVEGVSVLVEGVLNLRRTLLDGPTILDGPYTGHLAPHMQCETLNKV